MTDQPLVPFHPPIGLGVSVNASAGTIGGIVFFLAFVFWAVYTLVACYHWVKYSHAASVAYPTITLHLVVSGTIILYALSGLVGVL